MNSSLIPMTQFGANSEAEATELALKSSDNETLKGIIKAFGPKLVDDALVYSIVGEPLSQNPNASEETLKEYLDILKESQYGLIPSLVRRFTKDKRIQNRTLNKILADKGLDKSLVIEEEIAAAALVPKEDEV